MQRLVAMAVFVPLLLGSNGCAGGARAAPIPTTCVMTIRGAVTEDLRCVATAVRGGPVDAGYPGTPGFALQVNGYRGASGSGALPEPAATIAIDLAGAPPPGMTQDDAHALAASASAWQSSPAGHTLAYLAESRSGEGSVSVRFSALPAPGAAPDPVHGTADATLLPISRTGGNVTIHVVF